MGKHKRKHEGTAPLGPNELFCDTCKTVQTCKEGDPNHRKHLASQACQRARTAEAASRAAAANPQGIRSFFGKLTLLTVFLQAAVSCALPS